MVCLDQSEDRSGFGTVRAGARCFRIGIDPAGYAQAKALFSWLWHRGDMEAFVVGAQLMQGERGFGKILELTVGMDLGAAGAELEKFATKLPEAGVRIPRGFRADDSADQGVEPFGAGGG